MSAVLDPRPPAKIVLDGVSKTFRTTKPRTTFLARLFGWGRGEVIETTALKDLSLQIPEGRFVTIVGPSGCGKTTALRMMDGLATPDSGRVLLNGTPVEGPRRECGFVFQDFGLYPWRTVIDNVAYGLELRGMGQDERHARARQVIDLVGLAGREWSYPHQLSGGMQQRVGIARMLAVEPEVLLMDEPFGALDALTRKIMQLELLRILATRPASTVVFVTHDLDEAILLADTVIVMTGTPGRVKDIVDVPFARDGRSEELIETPAFAELRHRLWQQLQDAIPQT
jgi:NitT/TauT family transport system ATP-binding protein